MTGTGVRIERRYVGGPLDGQVAKGRSLTRGPDGAALRAADGDRAVDRLNFRDSLGKAGQVYIRRRSSYVWVPDLWAQRRAAV